ncbi:MAG: cob(I)yrinic acid a,c-diamide adenosyltransferase [Oscillospiraceae bacterium]|nr:cob(I)yrinic acid a,c-diamide adenosyltransferase [Oscillospiraceae bacterium]
MERGLVHLYWGDGKGKTTCALGLGLRVCGSGGRTLLVQFLKNNRSSERAALVHVPGFESLPGPEQIPFSFQMNQREREEVRRLCADLLKEAETRCADGAYRLLILDEVCDAVEEQFLTEEQVLRCLAERPASLEVVLTGHHPSGALQEAADYITYFQAQRHPYEKGVPARQGIEY